MKEKRKSNEQTESEEEIWDYKPIKRVKKKDPGKLTLEPSNIARSKVTAQRKTRSSFTQSTAKESSENDVHVLFTHDNNKIKIDSEKLSASGDGKIVKTKGPTTRKRLASKKSQNKPSTQSLHNKNDNVEIADKNHIDQQNDQKASQQYVKNKSEPGTSKGKSGEDKGAKDKYESVTHYVRPNDSILSQQSVTNQSQPETGNTKSRISKGGSITKRRSSVKKKPQATPQNKLFEVHRKNIRSVLIA